MYIFLILFLILTFSPITLIYDTDKIYPGNPPLYALSVSIKIKQRK